MSLNGIDIASYQAGIDLGAVPCDFAIIKATEGLSYVNPDCDRAFQSGLDNGKLLGVYHFADGTSSGSDEADFFVNNIGGYVGKAILVLDWEANALNCGPGYALDFLNRVYERTGVKPLIYMSGSVAVQFDWSQVSAADYGLWIAAYYTDSLGGYNSDAPGYDQPYWSNVAILQYTSGGQLPNWGGSLDLDVFYGDENTWNAYVGCAAPEPSDVEAPTGDKPLSDRPICNEKCFGIWVRNVKDNVGIKAVRVAVWSTANGQDDLVWNDMQPAPSGEANAYAFSVDADKHGGVRDGNIIYADVYAYDNAGNQACLGRAITEMTTKIDTPLTAVGNVYYKAYVQNYGWLDTVNEGQTAGTVGKNLRMEALAVHSNIHGVSIELQGHVQDYGWMSTVSDNQAIGTMTQSKRLEAIRLKLTGDNASKYDILYRAHIADVGWQNWVRNWDVAGTTNQKRAIQAVEIKITKR